jgi:hypothetical protein
MGVFTVHLMTVELPLQRGVAEPFRSRWHRSVAKSKGELAQCFKLAMLPV